MRYATDIQVKQAIIHKVFRDDCILSETLLPSSGHEGIVSYLGKHIENALHDSSAKAARFVAIDDSLVSGLCKGLLSDNIGLVDGSRQLAQRLHGIVSQDARITDGTLAVCYYLGMGASGQVRYLAMLKLDSTEAFRPVTRRDEKGKLYVGFQSEQDLMPTAAQKLHKCAFVRCVDPRPEYDMMLLDRQAATGGPSPIAKFFAETFLGATVALDSRQRTDRLYRALVSAHNRLRPALGPQENEILDQAIHSAIASTSINVESWVAALDLATTAKQQIADVVAKELPDVEFELDTSYAQRLVRKRRFEGDEGLRVEVTAEGYTQVVRSVEPMIEPGMRPCYRIVIQTEKWQEVRR